MFEGAIGDRVVRGGGLRGRTTTEWWCWFATSALKSASVPQETSPDGGSKTRYHPSGFRQAALVRPSELASQIRVPGGRSFGSLLVVGGPTVSSGRAYCRRSCTLRAWCCERANSAARARPASERPSAVSAGPGSSVVSQWYASSAPAVAGGERESSTTRVPTDASALLTSSACGPRAA